MTVPATPPRAKLEGSAQSKPVKTMLVPGVATGKDAVVFDTGDDAVLVFQTGCLEQRAAQLYSSLIELKRWRIIADAPM